MENQKTNQDFEEKDECKDNEEFSSEEIDSNLEATKEEINEEIKEEDQETKKLKSELADYKDKYLRLNAEFQNYRRRTEKEKNDIYKFGSEKIIKDILPILDNFERALSTSQENSEDSIKDGIEMIYKQFIDVLKKHGVEEIESIGKEFDPMLHHAVMQDESEESEPNTIIEVFQKGYMLHSKVIRPSMVKVSK